jgi:VanZ family protein
MFRRAKQLVMMPRFWQAMLAFFWLALFVGTHLTKRASVSPTDHLDKIAHFGAFLVLALLFAATWQISAGLLTGAHLRIAWIVLALYAAIDEWTQLLVGRDASVIDWLADVTGAALGLALFAHVGKWRRRRQIDSAAITEPQ